MKILPRAIILAGGKSSRFGSNKALAQIGGQTLTALCVSHLLEVFSRVLIVAKAPAEFGVEPSPRVRLVYDQSPEHAAMVGLCEGLRRTDRTLNYVTGCDMPGIVPDLIRQLHALARGQDCALRCDENGRPQPLGGFYSKAALPTITRFLSEEDYRLSSLTRALRTAALPFSAVTRLDPDLLSFLNVNTREDLDIGNWV